MKNSRIQIIIVFVLLLMNACSRQLSEDKSFVITPHIDNSHARATLITASKGLINNLILLNPIVREVGRFTQAQVRVQNLSDDRYTFEYKSTWEDDQGFSVGDGIWQRYTLTGGESHSFISVGKTPQAKKIVFTIRLPDDYFIDMERQRYKQ